MQAKSNNYSRIVASLRGYTQVSRKTITVLLLALSIIVFAARYHTHTEPLERDQPGYALVAHEMLCGRGLYSGIFDQKPPAIYLTYAAAELVTGYTRQTVFYLGVVAALITLLGVYAAGLGAGSALGGLAAATLWTVICSDLDLQANQPNAEAFMNACLIWAFALVVRRREELLSWREAVLVGLLYALATLYKQIVILIPLLVMGVLLLCASDAAQRRVALRNGVIVIGVIVAAWASIAGFFALEGRFDAYYFATVTYNQAYSGSPIRNLLFSFGPHFLLPRIVWFAAPLAALLLVMCVSGLRRRNRLWALFAAYAIGIYVAVALPGRFYAHYYQLWLPALACGFGWTVDAAFRPGNPRIGRRIAVAAAIALAICFIHEALYFRFSAVEWSVHKYGYEFVTADRVGHRLKSLLLPHETLYDANVEPEFYLVTGKRPPSGIFYSEPLIGRPRADQFTERLLRDLNRRPPDLVVTADASSYGALRPEVSRWIKTNYRPVIEYPVPPPIISVSRFTVWMRRGSNIEARLIRSGVDP